MKVNFNTDILLWAIGVLQPASASDVLKFISYIYPEIKPLPLVKEIDQIFSELRNLGFTVRVHGKSRLYSLTYAGNIKISTKLRRHRDKARLFLLKDTRQCNIAMSGEEKKELVGDSPTTDGSSTLQEFQRPIKTAAAPRYPRHSGRFYWPLVSKQLNFRVGLNSSSPDIFLKYYSFPSLKSIHKISPDPASGNDLSITDLALSIGVSPRLLTSLLHATHKYYRQFNIGKRGGGERTISSPRTFLKVIQYWILDYFLYPLESHPICHSYQRGKSILTNAFPHINNKYVANIDISDFFGSITTDMTKDLLGKNGFGEQLSKTIARLVSLNNGLPQGAPTSPIISNAYLYSFDEFAAQISQDSGLNITRYADDITISGKNKDLIAKVITIFEQKLSSIGLKLNAKKTRIASRGGQQRVTGIVVNEKALPPRKLRRCVRAMFHNANKYPEEHVKKINILRGYLSYFISFPDLKGSQEIVSYKKTLKKLTNFVQQSH
jgi:retron-type reverse transcriptase